MIETALEKKLQDGTTLKLVSWVSDFVRPGQTMYQLHLVHGFVISGFPINYEDFSEKQMRGIYDSITSRADFEKVRDGQDARTDR